MRIVHSQKLVLVAATLIFTNSSQSAETKLEADLALRSPRTTGSAGGVWMVPPGTDPTLAAKTGKFYSVEQVGGISVAIVEGKPFKTVSPGQVLLTGMAELKAAANDGDTTAQRLMALFHREGRLGMSKDIVEAYKWAALGAVQGDKLSVALVQEFAFFMNKEEVHRAREAALDHLKRKLEKL